MSSNLFRIKNILLYEVINMMKNYWNELMISFNACAWYEKLLLIITVLMIAAFVLCVLWLFVKELVWLIFKPDSKQEKLEKQKRAEKLKQIKARG